MNKFELMKEENPSQTLFQTPGDFKLLEEDPKEITRQLALLDSELFKNITRDEISSLAWTSSKDKQSKSPNIVAMTHRFNNIACWITMDILDSSNAKRRLNKICQFIRIAKHSRDIRNYNGLKCILSGLQSSAIHRLDRTWSMIPKKEIDIFDRLVELMSPEDNCNLYRRELARQKLPCIPYLGTYLGDMTFLVEALNHAHEDNKDLSNSMEKMLQTIEHFQKSSYPFNPNAKIQSFLRKDMFIPEMYPFFEEEAFKKSLILEPREQEKEKKALQPSHQEKERKVFDSYEIPDGAKKSHKYSSSDGVNWNELMGTTEVSSNSTEKRGSFHKRQSSAQQPKRTGAESQALASFSFRFRPLEPNVKPQASTASSNTNISESSSIHSSSNSIAQAYPMGIGEKCGKLRRKKEMEDGKRADKRKWKDFWATLSPTGILTLVKSSKGQQKTVLIELQADSTVEEAVDYKKRPHVIRLCPKPTESMLFQTMDIQDMASWMIHFQSIIQKLKPANTSDLISKDDSEYEQFISDLGSSRRFYCYKCEEEVITSASTCPYCKRDFLTI